MPHDPDSTTRPDALSSAAIEGVTPRWAMYISVLVGIVVLITVGLVGVLSMGPGKDGAPATRPIASVHASSIPLDPPSTSPKAGRVSPADVVAVDLRTGTETPLPRSIRSIVGAGLFRVSPDGTKIAFDDEDSIIVADVGGSRIRRFRPNGGGVSSPAWSPDGTRIVFSQGTSAFILDIETGRSTLLVRERRPIRYPNFSPDGRTILYTATRNLALTLRTVPSTGGPSAHLLHGAFGAYSPDGTTIAFRRTTYDGVDTLKLTSGRLWLANADGSHAREIGPPAGWMSQQDPEALWPTWSPDGTRIAYQPTRIAAIRVMDIGLGRGALVGLGRDPTWLDDHTLIISDFQELGP